VYVYAKISQIEEWMINGVWKAGWFDQYGWEYPWAYQTIMKYAEPGNRLLDVGAGTCQIGDKIHTDGPNLEVHVIDSKQAFETIGVFRPHLIYHEGLLGLTHDLQPETFDIIYSVSVLEHIHEAGGDDGLMNALLDMKRLLKPGGLMIHAVDIVLDPDVYRRWKGFAIENFIRPLNMQVLPEFLDKPPSRRAMLLDPDLFVVSPQTTHELRWCGKNVGLDYFRVTGIGFILRKAGS
jgi:SAM-dependent methyltransferase